MKKGRILTGLGFVSAILMSAGCNGVINFSSSSESSSSRQTSSSSSNSSIVVEGPIIDLLSTGGIVEAEDFVYSEKCQVENTTDIGGGKNVGWTEDGTLLRYNVEFPESGYYKVGLRVSGGSSDNLGRILQLYIDNVRQLQFEIIGTGGWQNWDTSIEYDMFESGVHVVELRATREGFNINKMTFTKVAETKAEYDEGKELGSNATVIRANAVEMYLTSTEQSGDGSWYDDPKTISNPLAKQDSIDITEESDYDAAIVEIDPTKTYQSFLGLGTSLEESTINNVAQMDATTRRTFLKSLIDPVNGAGMSLIRLTIGTADFTGQNFYTYYDNAPVEEPDWINGFSIQKDIDYKIVDTIKEVIEIAKELGVENEIKFFSSPWTPPGWMKTPTSESNSYGNNAKLLKGGRLNDAYIDDLAMYYTRYLEEYAKLGIPIYAMTLQNEPMLQIDYPSCAMSESQQGQLAIALKRNIENSVILQEKGIATKLWAFDHNFSEGMSFTRDLFNVAGAKEAIDGIAFHDYSGSPSIMQQVTDTYLDENQTVAMTERSVWGSGGAARIIDYFRNGSVSYNSWVTMLDSNIAPEQWVGTPGPTMFVRRAGSETEYWATPEFYITGNFARFIRPGYVRVDSTKGSAYSVANVVFKAPNSNQYVAVLANQTLNEQSVKFRFNNQEFIVRVPSKQVATVVWDIE